MKIFFKLIGIILLCVLFYLVVTGKILTVLLYSIVTLALIVLVGQFM